MAISFEPGWTGICSQCGQKIWDGFPEAIDSCMQTRGYVVGFATSGNFPPPYPITFPVCKTCLDAVRKKYESKILKQQFREIVPKLKKIYACPFRCFENYHNTGIYATKAELIEHLSKNHSSSERTMLAKKYTENE